MSLNPELEKIFPESNKQVNENDDGIPKQKLLNEISENYITGFATAESNVENMKNPCKCVYLLIVLSI